MNNILNNSLDRISPEQQKAVDIRMIIAAKIVDRVGSKKESYLIESLAIKFDISFEECHTWIGGVHDFSISDLTKIEKFLGEKIFAQLK